ASTFWCPAKRVHVKTPATELLPASQRISFCTHYPLTSKCRTYAVRRIRDAFRENKNVKDPVEIQALVNKAKRDLEIIRRQVHIGQLYSTDKLIIETQEKPRT
uniref:LYR motif containing 4 n=1 Tax=Equus asinus TaxID=9793 RepID=A0A8C4M1W7_EQUAS